MEQSHDSRIALRKTIERHTGVVENTAEACFSMIQDCMRAILADDTITFSVPRQLSGLYGAELFEEGIREWGSIRNAWLHILDNHPNLQRIDTAHVLPGDIALTTDLARVGGVLPDFMPLAGVIGNDYKLIVRATWGLSIASAYDACWRVVPEP